MAAAAIKTIRRDAIIGVRKNETGHADANYGVRVTSDLFRRGADLFRPFGAPSPKGEGFWTAQPQAFPFRGRWQREALTEEIVPSPLGEGGNAKR